MNGTTYSSSSGGATLAYTFGADSVLYRWINVGKVSWNSSPVAQYFIDSADSFHFTYPSVVPSAPGATEHVHFYVDETNERCCYFETSPTIVYKAQ